MIHWVEASERVKFKDVKIIIVILEDVYIYSSIWHNSQRHIDRGVTFYVVDIIENGRQLALAHKTLLIHIPVVTLFTIGYGAI